MMEHFNRIREVLGGLEGVKALYDEPMSRHTSLGVGGRADAVVFAENENQLAEIVKRLKEKGIDFFPAGNLTNVIVKDRGYRGAILMTGKMKMIRHWCEDDEDYKVLAQAGAPLATLVGYTVTESLTGLEFCAGIPGSVGGAIWMNAGAYGKEIKDVVQKISVLDAEGNIRKIMREDVSFDYRKTDFARGTIILGAEFTLKKGKVKTLGKESMNCYVGVRKGIHWSFPVPARYLKIYPVWLPVSSLRKWDLKEKRMVAPKYPPNMPILLSTGERPPRRMSWL